jgi:hypothetical protein
MLLDRKFVPCEPDSVSIYLLCDDILSYTSSYYLSYFERFVHIYCDGFDAWIGKCRSEIARGRNISIALYFRPGWTTKGQSMFVPQI